MRSVILLILIQGFCLLTPAQETDALVLHKSVSVPDSIKMILDEAYGNGLANASAHVYNILESDCYDWKDGIYRYFGQGPHFPTKIFIVYGDKIFVFNNLGFCNPLSVINEFVECSKRLSLPDNDIIKFLKGICDYLENEKDKTYGTYIKHE